MGQVTSIGDDPDQTVQYPENQYSARERHPVNSGSERVYYSGIWGQLEHDLQNFLFPEYNQPPSQYINPTQPQVEVVASRNLTNPFTIQKDSIRLLADPDGNTFIQFNLVSETDALIEPFICAYSPILEELVIDDALLHYDPFTVSEGENSVIIPLCIPMSDITDGIRRGDADYVPLLIRISPVVPKGSTTITALIVGIEFGAPHQDNEGVECCIGRICRLMVDCNGSLYSLLQIYSVDTDDFSVEGQAPCVVCLSEVATVVAIPCGHRALCQKCAQELLQHRDYRCAVCRASVESYKTINMAAPQKAPEKQEPQQTATEQPVPPSPVANKNAEETKE